MANSKDNQLIPWHNNLTGRCIKSVDSAKIEFVSEDQQSIQSDNFSSLKNIRYTDNGVIGVTSGMTKINSTALSSHPKIRTMYHFKKVQPEESHVLVQASNNGESESKVFQNTTVIPSAGNFSATALHTDASGSTLGRFSSAPDEHVVYCNSKDPTMTWGGDETQISSFEVYDEFGGATPSFTYNYTLEMQNTLSNTTNVASFFRDGDTPIKVTLRIGNTLPIEGFRFTISTANTNTLDTAMSVSYWDGSQWQAVSSLVDGTITGSSPNEISFGQTGNVTFTSTESVAKPNVINGVYGFYYKVEIIGADAATRVSSVTVKEPFQPLQDFWDGEPRIADSVQLFEDNIFKDNTVNVFEDSFIFNESTDGNTASYMRMDSLTTSTENLTVGFAQRSQGIQVKMIPDHSNGDIAATGTIAFGAITNNISLTALSVDSVSIISQSVTSAAQSEDAFADLVAKEVNEKLTSPNYTATSDKGIVTITADTRGTGPNTFVIAATITSTGTFQVLPMANGKAISAAITVKYWNGTAWVTVGTVSDGTFIDSASFGKSGIITWNAIAENTEFKKEINGETPLYYYQLSWDQTFSKDTLCYLITGIPVQRRISNYKFSLHAQNRLWLFSDQSSIKNQSIVSNLGELNTFNGKGSGDPLRFGDRTEVVAAIELFERTTARVESHILVFKGNSVHVIEGDNPENWKIINLTDNIGCNAPYSLAASTLGFEFSPLQRKQVAIWQGSSGIYMFDNNAIHPISDDISNFFDQRNTESINLAKADSSYGFFEVENGEHYYHWCFASGSSTVINNEWLFDIKRQKWFEVDRGSGKAIQGGGMVVDTTGNIYNYAFEDGGYLQRLNNGTDYDGNDIDYEMAFGDVLPAANINVLTSVDSVRLAIVSKSSTSSTISCFHYGDTKDAATKDRDTGNSFYTLTTSKAGQRLAFPFKRINTPQHMTHKLKFTISTNNEVGSGFEPLFVGGFYKARGHSELNITD